ncbi:MAG: VOC family protein [Cephaloticoccus sp.]
MEQPPVPRINGVVETAIYADDLAEAVAFYRDVLGLEPMTGDPARFQAFAVGRGQVFLLFKRGATLHAMPADEGIIPPHDGHGSLHFAFAISRDEFAAWRARLEAHGVTIVSDTGWSRGGRSLYFHDPAGNLGELVTPGIWPNY